MVRYREGGAFTEAALHIVDGVVQTGDGAPAPAGGPTPPAPTAA